MVTRRKNTHISYKPNSFQRHRVGGWRQPALPSFASNSFSPLANTITYSRSDSLRRYIPYILVALALLLIFFAAYSCANAAPVKAKIDGKRVKLDEGETIAMAITQANIETQPGRFLAIDGSVLNETGGMPFTAIVNGAPAKPNAIVHDRDSIELQPGEDITEPSYEKAICNYTEASNDDTWGAIRELKASDPSAAGRARIGEVSGKIVEEKAPGNAQQGILTMYNVNTSEQVAALTFDDGPWDETTEAILDVLKENDAKATFFVLGNRIDAGPEMAALVKREIEEGHQVCTHTYSHAADGAGFDLGAMSHDARVEDVVKGQDAIARATGKPADRMFRAPGGNYSPAVAVSVAPYVSYEIGWNVDTQDWTIPGEEAIEEALLSIEPGNVILMHDGGGDRTQTVEALKSALPKLKQKGWQFVTVEELLTYNSPTESSENYEADEAESPDGQTY